MKRGLNKRRLFWGAIVIVTTTLLVTCYWWYQANFPLPSRFFAKKTGSPTVQWFMDKRASWIRERAIAHTLRLHLPGTRWKDVDSGAVVDFGEDGVFRWIERPYPTITLPDFQTNAITTEVNRLIEENIAGAEFEIRRSPNCYITWERNGNWARRGKNIFFKMPEGKTIEGLFGTDGRELVLHVEDADDDLDLKFERRLK